MNKTTSGVRYLTISAQEEDQRIDNFLITFLKTVPKSKIYRILRKGEVRVNKKRVDPSYRIREGDAIRLPPLFIEEKAKSVPPNKENVKFLLDRVLFEDENLLVLNKPSGMSVHGGSTVRVGIIEAMQYLLPQFKHLELVHRLDSETSGCLILAKKKKILRELHSLLRDGQVKKIYWALTKGRWKKNELRIDQPLHKSYQEGGKHVVKVDPEGKSASTLFHPLKEFNEASLMEVSLLTGRTHQIRVHSAHQGHPIAQDDRYGDADFNKFIRALGLKRLFLHARLIDFTLPSTQQHIKVVAPLDNELEKTIQALQGMKNNEHEGSDDH